MTTNNTPLEAVEQQAFAEWLEWQGLKHTAIVNETYTKSWKQKLKNKRAGLNPGLSDMLVLIRPSESKDGEGYTLYIEMKRQKGGVQSADQKEWERELNGLNVPNIQYYLCKGCDEAVKVVSHYLKTVGKSIF